MKLLQKILYATDFEEAAGDALRSAAGLARQFESEVHLLHVISIEWDVPAEIDQVKASALSRLQALQADLEDQGVRCVAAEVVVGTPFENIQRYADRHDMNVIVVGAGNETGEEAGIVAQRLMRRCASPVWVARQGATFPARRILCPTDFSDPSRRALINAVHLARAGEAELSVLHVVESTAGLLPGVDPLSAEALAELEARHGAQFDKMLRGIDLHGVRWRRVVRHGRPHREIIAEAETMQADLLVMGSVGRSWLSRILIGSVADKVVHKLPCSVITVKAEHAIRPHLQTEVADLETEFERGRELLVAGLPMEALTQFERCIARDMMFAPAWEGQAEAHERLGQRSRAENCRAQAEYIRYRLWTQTVEGDVRRQMGRELRGEMRPISGS